MMKFGTFTFSNPPESLHVTYRRDYSVDAAADGQWTVYNPSYLGACVEGEGVFCGSTAQTSFESLLLYLKQGVTAQLYLPQQTQPITAFLVKLERLEEADYIRYRFQFVETAASS